MIKRQQKNSCLHTIDCKMILKLKNANLAVNMTMADNMTI